MHLQTKMNKLLYISKMTLLDLKGIAVLKHRDITKKRKRISIYFRNKPLKPVDAADKLFGIFF